MITIALKRIAALPLILLAVAAITFGLSWASPYDPAEAYATSVAGSEGLSQELMASYRARWGLDDPKPVQFGRWLGNVATGDLGRSHLYNGEPVTQVIIRRLGVSALLVTTSLAIVLAGSLLLGTLAARFRDTVVDHGIRMLAYLSTFAPSFWVGLLLIIVFGVNLGWLPTGGTTDPRNPGTGIMQIQYLVLPAITLALSQQGWFTLFVRSSVLEAMNTDHVRFARSEGAPRTVALLREALPNGLLPYLTLVGTHIPELIGGTILVETVFGWPGLGDLARRAAVGVDLPLLLGIVLAGAVLTVLGNLFADLAYKVADPRIRQASDRARPAAGRVAP